MQGKSLLASLDESVFDRDSERNSDSEDDQNNDSNASSWIPLNQSARQDKQEQKSSKPPTGLVEFERRKNWESSKPQQSKYFETAGIEVSLCYQKIWMRLQFSREAYEHEHAQVVPYTNLRSPEIKAAMLRPDIQTKLQKDMKKGISVTQCSYIENPGKQNERRQPLLFIRVPEWGMDFDREMLYSSVRNTLYQGSSNNLKRICFPSMISKEGPLDDQAQIVLQAIIDFIDETQDKTLESIVLRVGNKAQFEIYLEIFRSKIQQLSTKK